MDEENTQEQVRLAINQLIDKKHFLKALPFEEIDKLMTDDDFLGMQSIAMKKNHSFKTSSIKISGLQLFDKYEYRIHFSWKN